MLSIEEQPKEKERIFQHYQEHSGYLRLSLTYN